MFLVAKLHPNIEETEKKDYNGTLLSRASKEDVIHRFYKNKQEIPLCIDHRDIGSTGHVKDTNRVGRVSDLFLNNEGELMVKCELFKSHSEGYKEVNHGIFLDKERWGVSVGLTGLADPSTGKKKSRNLVHVALTSDPAFADEGTFITKWGLNEKDVDRAIAHDYQNGFFRKEMRAKLEGYVKKDTSRPTMDATTTASVPQQEEERLMELDSSKATFEHKPRTTPEKRDELIRMREHVANLGLDFFQMDKVFKSNYNALETEYEKEIEEQNTYVNDLVSEYNISPERRDELFKMLSGTTPEAQKHQPMMVEVLCCSATKYKQSEERNAELEKQKELLALENAQMKKQLEQEAINLNNKRARTAQMPYNFSPQAVTPKKQISFQTVVPSEQPRQQQQTPSNTYASYLENVQVRGRVAVNNPLINGLVQIDQRASGYENTRKMPFHAKTPGESMQWNMFDNMCNSSSIGNKASTYQ